MKSGHLNTGRCSFCGRFFRRSSILIVLMFSRSCFELNTILLPSEHLLTLKQHISENRVSETLMFHIMLQSSCLGKLISEIKESTRKTISENRVVWWWSRFISCHLICPLHMPNPIILKYLSRQSANTIDKCKMERHFFESKIAKPSWQHMLPIQAFHFKHIYLQTYEN